MATSDPTLDVATDTDFDDLPRTLRREREARAREARERAARDRQLSDDALTRSSSASSEFTGPPANLAPDYGATDYGRMHGAAAGDAVPAVVKRFDVPFFALMMFYIKAVLAAVPALILLGVMLWFAGQGLKTYFPELIHTRILISFPNPS